MKCPVCDRSLAPTLSICPSCGAMMRDTVREELQSKVMPAIALRAGAKPLPVREPVKLAPPQAVTLPPVMRKTQTASLAVSKTSPTLVEFQTKTASLPEWRLQLQNAVQQRRGASANGDAAAATVSALLRAEIVERKAPAAMSEVSDPRVAAAMRRIEASRKAFRAPAPQKAAPPRPFGVVAPTSNAGAASAAAPAKINLPKPKLVEPMHVIEKRDTNKLPPIEIVAPTLFDSQPEPSIEKPIGSPAEFSEIKRIHIKADIDEIEYLAPVTENDDEIEDLAPFSMRFGSGLFDLIIGAFASMLLLSPVAFTTYDWWTAAGLLTFLGVFAVFMFLYMTVCVGIVGKTLGMRLFSLELVDAVENEYPTLYQAAVNSSVFLISLAFGGLGFLTIFSNEENRALHDLLSGTIIVKEF